MSLRMITSRARPPRLVSVGLEVTTRCCLPAEECRRRFRAAGGPLGIVADMLEVWMVSPTGLMTFHDPLAAAVIFEPKLCTYASGCVTVETQSERLAGLTSFRRQRGSAPHRIAVSVNPEAFSQHYFDVVGG